MPRRLRRWRTGYVIAGCCLALGGVRFAHGEYGWVTWASVGLAPVHAFAATVVRREHHARRIARGLGPDPQAWTRQPSRLRAWLAAERGVARHPGDIVRTGTDPRTIRTRDRLGAALAGAAAVVGLTLVLTDHDHRDHHDRGPRAEPTWIVTGIDARPTG